MTNSYKCSVQCLDPFFGIIEANTKDHRPGFSQVKVVPTEVYRATA